MSTERLYWQDPFQFHFTAEVTDRLRMPDGRPALVLARTYFYPTGGGQEHDTGVIGDARVIDVLSDEKDDTILHVLDRPISGSDLPAHIDASRRLAFMQEHSGQHILSQAFVQAFGLDTVSARLSNDSPSTIDVSSEPRTEAELSSAENAANTVIWEDRPIRTYFVAGTEIGSVPLRKPPSVQGPVRIVQIEGFDYSACGGTHCARTGMVGVVKILKTEKRGDKLRVYFHAGRLAFQVFQEEHTVILNTVRLLSVKPEAVVESVATQARHLDAAEKRISELEAEVQVSEVRTLVARAEPVGSTRLVLATLRERTPAELRRLASSLQAELGLVALLAAYDGAKLSLIVSCAADTGLDATALARKHLDAIGARGGGDARLAQGGGAATEVQVREFFDHSRDYIKLLKSM